MVEKPKRSRVGDQPRGVEEPEWEVFVRAAESDTLRHVGSVSAPSADVAHEETTKLFGRFAADVWVCPASEVRRYSTHTLDEEAEPVPVGAGEEAHTDER